MLRRSDHGLGDRHRRCGALLGRSARGTAGEAPGQGAGSANMGVLHPREGVRDSWLPLPGGMDLPGVGGGAFGAP